MHDLLVVVGRRGRCVFGGKGHRGGAYRPTDGFVDPPRNVRAYSLALHGAGVELRERTEVIGLTMAAGRGGAYRVTGVLTSAGTAVLNGS